VAKPANVEIRTDVTRPRVALRTEQAVGVAMVLHELCFNALVHGLAGGGTLTIRTRPGTGEGELAIDVIDDGTGCCDPRDAHDTGAACECCAGAARGAGNGAPANGPPRGTGIGLTLVRGLVNRELRGRFLLRSRPGGGTVATIEFPVPPAADPAAGPDEADGRLPAEVGEGRRAAD
jgi:two-component sensor histidine kinase